MALAAALLVAATAVAQKYVPPPPPIVCVPTKKDPCDTPPPATTPAPASVFPFPGEPGDPASKQTSAQTPAAAGNPFPGEPGDPKPAAPSTPPSASDNFPFPGEPADSKSGAPPAPAPANDNASKFPFPGEPSSTPGESSSSSNSSSASADDAPPDPDTPATGGPLTRSQRRMLPKVEDKDHRELEDLDISKYYIGSGNFKGAYLRAQDAVKMMPDDPDAHYALALAAEKMRLPDEAIKEYKNYLTADPQGIHAKVAAKALTALDPNSVPRK